MKLVAKLMPKKFENFLRKNRVYTEYIKSFPNDLTEREIKPFFSKEDIRYYIIGAFPFVTTKSGQSRWIDLHNEWVKMK
jgi:hypothetical protein